MKHDLIANDYMETISKIIATNQDRDWEKFVSNITFAIRTLPFIRWGYWLKQYYKIFQMMPEENIFTITSKGQILGKKWIFEEMKRLDLNYGVIFLLAGWSGFIGRMILDSNQIQCEKIRSFDISPECTKMAEILNWDWRMTGKKFKTSTQDLTKMNYVLNEFYYARKDGVTQERLIESPRTIINTSCEHIENFEEWWSTLPKGLIAILQSTNHTETDEHVNVVHNIEEFKEQAPMSMILYSGEREFFFYKRFMLIGVV